MANLGFSVDAVVSDMLMPDARRVGAREMQVVSSQSVDATPDQRSFGIRKVVRRVVQTLSGSRLRVTALIREYVASTTQCSGGGRGAITLPEVTDDNRDANRSIPEAMDIVALKNDQERLDAFFNLNVDRFVEVLIEELTGRDIDNMSRASTSFARIAALIYQRRTMLDQPSFYRLGPLDSLMGVGRVNIGAMQHAESLIKATEMAEERGIITQPSAHVTHMSVLFDAPEIEGDDENDTYWTKYKYMDQIAYLVWRQYSSLCVQLDVTFNQQHESSYDSIYLLRCSHLKSLRIMFINSIDVAKNSQLYNTFITYSEIPLIESVSVIVDYDLFFAEKPHIYPDIFLDHFREFAPNKIQFYIETNAPIKRIYSFDEHLSPELIFRKVEIVYNGYKSFNNEAYPITVERPAAFAFILRTPQPISLTFSVFTKLVWIEGSLVDDWHLEPEEPPNLDVLVVKNLDPRSEDNNLSVQTTYTSKAGVTSYYVVDPRNGKKFVLLDDRDMTNNPMDIAEWRVAYNKHRTS